MFVARDSVFLEKDSFSKEPSGRNIQLNEIQAEQQTQQQEDIDDVTKVGPHWRSEWQRQSLARYKENVLNDFLRRSTIIE